MIISLQRAKLLEGRQLGTLDPTKQHPADLTLVHGIFGRSGYVPAGLVDHRESCSSVQCLNAFFIHHRLSPTSSCALPASSSDHPACADAASSPCHAARSDSAGLS